MRSSRTPITRSQLVLDDDRHVWLVSLQLLFGLLFLAGILRDFRERERLITDCIEEED